MGLIVHLPFTKDQIDKLGNAIRFLTKDAGIPKTNLLKLIYILDEISIKRFGIPFFNLEYRVWKFGPVEPNLYSEFSSRPSFLANYFELKHIEGSHTEYECTLVYGKGDFIDDEFSDNDISLLEYVQEKLSAASAKDLVAHTHRENSPWRISAEKSGYLSALEAEKMSVTDEVVDTSVLISHDPQKIAIYNSYIDQFGGTSMDTESC